MTVIADVVAGRPGALYRLDAEVERRRADGDAATIIDELAHAAGTSAHALEALAGVIQTHRLAQPAIRQMVVNEADVDDLEQAVLAVVALRVGQFRGEARFTTWLHRIAANEAKMFLRSRSRRPPMSGHPTVPERGYLARLSTLAGDRDVVERALAALPDLYRQILVLREVSQLEYDEIASQLQIPVGTVRSRLHKARRLVARQLAADSADDIANPG